MWTGRTGSALSATFAIEVRPRFVESVSGKRGSSWAFAEPLESKLDGQVEYDMDEQGTFFLFYMAPLYVLTVRGRRGVAAARKRRAQGTAARLCQLRALRDHHGPTREGDVPARTVAPSPQSHQH
jgi:hypothetical protein